MPERGKLIVIEGTDGSGKATQTRMLIERLANEEIPAATMSFPRYHESPTGRIVGQCCLGKDWWGKDKGWFGDFEKVDPLLASLYYAADRLEASTAMKIILASGTNLVLDRYRQSNMAHQGGKYSALRDRVNLFKKLEQLEIELLGIPKEDLIVFLHMPTNVAMELRQGREATSTDHHENNPTHLKNAEKTYLELADIYRWKKISCAPDGTATSLKTPEQISKEVYAIARKIIK